MKKNLLCILLCVLLFVACDKKDNILEDTDFIIFTATIEEVNNDSSLLVRTEDQNVEFDLASVSYDRDLELDYIFQIGEQVRLTILPEIRESYPVQVTAIKIEKVDETP